MCDKCKIKVAGMAKKKKGAPRRRRRASVKCFDIGAINIQRGLAMGGGAVLSKLTTKLAADLIKPTGDANKDKTKGLIVAGAKFALGMVGAGMIKDPMIKDICYGFSAGAAIEAMPYVAPSTANPYKAGEKVAGVGNYSPQLQANNMRAFMQVSGYDPVYTGVGSRYENTNSGVAGIV
jgi:hypothetical protein